MDNSIRKFLIRNALVTYFSLALAALCVVVTYLSFDRGVEESRKYLYMIKTDGEVVPLEWVNRRENISIEMKHHVVMFVENFYDLNQYKWERSIEKALWLGDFEQLHTKRMNDGYYNRFIQFGAEQFATIDPEAMELYMEGGETYFRVIINLTEKMGGIENHYIIFSKGKIAVTDRNFPHNPHGLFISDYLEEAVKKLEE